MHGAQGTQTQTRDALDRLTATSPSTSTPPPPAAPPGPRRIDRTDRNHSKPVCHSRHTVCPSSSSHLAIQFATSQLPICQTMNQLKAKTQLMQYVVLPCLHFEPALIAESCSFQLIVRNVLLACDLVSRFVSEFPSTSLLLISGAARIFLSKPPKPRQVLSTSTQVQRSELRPNQALLY